MGFPRRKASSDTFRGNKAKLGWFVLSETEGTSELVGQEKVLRRTQGCIG